MDYTIVNLKEKTVVGLSTRLGNNDPNMQQKIGELWQNLYAEDGAYTKIANKANLSAIGLYTDYAGEEYTAFAGVEVTKAANPEMASFVIPAGKYAKFSLHGDMIQAVAAGWQAIWQMDLPRSYTADFEEYLTDENGECDMANCDIDIYIALK